MMVRFLLRFLLLIFYFNLHQVVMALDFMLTGLHYLEEKGFFTIHTCRLGVSPSLYQGIVKTTGSGVLEDRLRTTSILVLASWNFKLKVLRYSRNCSLHNTLITSDAAYFVVAIVMGILGPFLVVFLPNTLISFTKLRFRRSFLVAQHI